MGGAPSMLALGLPFGVGGAPGRIGGFCAHNGLNWFGAIAGGTGGTPRPTGETLGWRAGDNTLLWRYRAPHRKMRAEARRYYMDFEAVAELVNGDTIATAVITTSLPGLRLYDGAIDGPRVIVTVYAGVSECVYSVSFRITTAAGAILERFGTLYIVG